MTPFGGVPPLGGHFWTLLDLFWTPLDLKFEAGPHMVFRAPYKIYFGGYPLSEDTFGPFLDPFWT
jgi:hypothetical protein